MTTDAQDTHGLPAHMQMELDGWVAEFNDLKAFKETVESTIRELRRQVAEADAARRHAQAVSSDLVENVRALEAKLNPPAGVTGKLKAAWDQLRRWPELHTAVLDEIQEHNEIVADLEAKLAEKGETIASVTTWANETFGPATIEVQIDRAWKEFRELLQLRGLDTDKIAEEAADVCICLFRVIGTLDQEAVNKKMAKNRARKWQVDGQGCAQHVE